MQFPDPLIPARLLRRYKRFLADMELEGGERVTAHCPNPGSMMGLHEPGSKVWVSPARNPSRKLRYTWELIAADGTLVGINTNHPNGLAEEAVKEGKIPQLAGYESLRREVKYGKNSRIDLLLTDPGRPDCYVEVKNVHLMRTPGLTEFPDSVTTRGAKHLVELGDIMEAGARAVMLFIVQRNDCGRFDVAGDIDAAYAEAFATARTRGVEVLYHGCEVDTAGIAVGQAIAIKP